MEIVKQKVGYYREVCSFSEIREEINDVVIPDTNPDFESVISAFASCTVTEKSLVSGCIRSSGTLETTVYYDSSASENGYLLQNSFSFSMSFDLNKVFPDDKLIFSVKAAETVCEVINSRKIRIKVKLIVSAQIFRADEINISGDILSEDTEGINVLTEKTEMTVLSEIKEKQFAFSEEIRISEDEISGDPDIIRWDSVWSAGEIKKMQNKAMIRGSVEISAYFFEDDFKKAVKRTYTLPFTQIVECSAEENDDLLTYINQEKCLIKAEMKEDGISLKCDLCVTASLMVFKKVETDILSDAYSTQFDTEALTEEVTVFGRLTDVRKESLMEGRFNTPDGVARIIDFCVLGCVLFDNDAITAEYFASVMYENEMGQIRNDKVILSFDPKTEKGIIACSCFAGAEKINVRTDASGAVISFDGFFNAKKQSFTVIEQLSDIKADKTKTRDNGKGNLVLKRAEKNETLWDMAKKYGTTRAAILSSNDIIQEVGVTEGKLIMIPFVK